MSLHLIPPLTYRKQKYVAVFLTKLKPTSHLIKKKKRNPTMKNQIKYSTNLTRPPVCTLPIALKLGLHVKACFN